MERSGGGAIVCDTTANTVRQGYRYTCDCTCPLQAQATPRQGKPRKIEQNYRKMPSLAPPSKIGENYRKIAEKIQKMGFSEYFFGNFSVIFSCFRGWGKGGHFSVIFLYFSGLGLPGPVKGRLQSQRYTCLAMGGYVGRAKLKVEW